MFPGGREDGPHDGKFPRTVVGTEAAGDLLPQFHHPTVAFREVVGEGHARIGEKAQNIRFADTQAQQQIMTNPPWLPAASFGFAAGAKQHESSRASRTVRIACRARRGKWTKWIRPASPNRVIAPGRSSVIIVMFPWQKVIPLAVLGWSSKTRS